MRTACSLLPKKGKPGKNNRRRVKRGARGGYVQNNSKMPLAGDMKKKRRERFQKQGRPVQRREVLQVRGPQRMPRTPCIHDVLRRLRGVHATGLLG